MTLGLVTLVLAAGLDVRWSAPGTCEQPDLSLLASANGRAEVTVSNPAPATWQLELTFLEPFQATRHLELGSCADVRRAARALLLLGLKGAEAFRAEPPPSPPPLTESVPEPTASPAPVQVSLALGALANVLAAPAVTPRLLLEARLSRGAFAGLLSVRGGLPASFAGGPIDGAAVIAWPAIGAELGGCLVLSPERRVRPAGCVMVLAEWWQLRGTGVSDPHVGSAALLGAGGRLEVALGLSDAIALTPFLAARGHLRRPSAQFDGSVALAAGALGLEAGLTVALRLN